MTYQVALDHQLFQGTGTEFLQVASSEIKHAYSELAAVLLKQVPETEWYDMVHESEIGD